MLQTTPSKKLVLICTGAMRECVEVDGVELSNSLNLRQKSPGTRAFTTRRSHTRSRVERGLFGRAERVAIGPKRDNVITYLNTRRWRDTTLDEMGSILEVGIPRKIPEDISDIYVHAGSYLELSHDKYISRFLLVWMNIDAIVQETTIYCRLQRLNSITHSLVLGDVYSAQLDPIKEQGEEKAGAGMATLMWAPESR